NGLASAAFGYLNIADALNSSAFGVRSTATAIGATAIGYEAMADREYSVSIGSDGNERNLIHVADAIAATDAVNLRQLSAAMATVAGGGATADLTPIALALGGGAAWDPISVTFTSPSFSVLGNNYSSVTGAISAISSQLGTNTTDIAAIHAGGGGGGPNAAEIAALQAQLTTLQTALQDAATQLANLQSGATIGTTGASDALALGASSNASQAGSTALGAGAQATGAQSTAIGQGAVASFDNSVAIGQGVETTRANQVAIGSASNTYTLAGINSAASRAAQSGPVYAVTADGAGNLATMDMEPWFARVDGLETSVRQTGERFRKQSDGVAMALALGGAQVLQPDQTFSVSGNLGYFDNSSAAGIGAIGKVSENVYVNVGVGAGLRSGTVGGRAGVSWGW
ncbi:MAG: YadA-like family protein, partial [Hyphomonas sp.]